MTPSSAWLTAWLRVGIAPALALVLVLLVGLPASGDGRLSAPEAFQRARSGEMLLIDVRSAAEWRETGLPEGAAAVTIHNEAGMVGFLEEVTALVGGDKERRIALICAAGMRSARAKRYLRAKGFTNVHDVSEGMVGRGSNPGWLARGLPTTACTTC